MEKYVNDPHMTKLNYDVLKKLNKIVRPTVFIK